MSGDGGEPLGDERDAAETRWRGFFFGSCKTSIFFNSPDKGMSPTGSGASWGAAGGNAAAGGTGETLERRDWDALGGGPHGNVLYIINNMCL